MFNISLPGINLSGVNHDEVIDFARRHNDQYVVGIGDDRGREEEAYTTVPRVIEAETGLKFRLVKSFGDLFAVYVPNFYGDAMDYGKLCEMIAPYTFELGCHMEPVEFSCSVSEEA